MIRGALLALACLAATAAEAAPRTILFVGNSFTQGAHSAVRNYRAETVQDLNGDGYGGVPALFKQFADQQGLDWVVSLETSGGKPLAFHLAEKRTVIDRPWDVVVLQDLSTFSRERPGDPASHIRDVGLLAAMLRTANPAAKVYVDATWSRPDQVYVPGARWSGQPIAQMAEDLQRGSEEAARASGQVEAVLSVGRAFNRAIAGGVADGNPYDGIAFGQLDLWTYDHYHASIAGYYLEALVIFGQVTGSDPRLLGRGEKAADALGLSPEETVALQRVAAEQLGTATSASAAPAASSGR